MSDIDIQVSCPFLIEYFAGMRAMYNGFEHYMNNLL